MKLSNFMITWEDFEKVDIRTGTIIKVEVNEKAKKPAYKLEIDFGELGVKKSSAQITKLYSIKDLINKQVLAVVNFPPKNIAGFLSEVLVLGVVDGEDIILLQPERRTNNGKRVG